MGPFPCCRRLGRATTMDPINTGARAHLASRVGQGDDFERCLLSICQIDLSKCGRQQCKDKTMRAEAKAVCNDTRIAVAREAHPRCVSQCRSHMGKVAKGEGREMDDIDMKMYVGLPWPF